MAVINLKDGTVTVTEDMRKLDRRYDELYERYGKPLEAEHAGQFLAVSASGETILGSTLEDVAWKTSKRFGPGSFLYKVGERSVGKLR